MFNTKHLSFHLSFGCTYGTHPRVITKMGAFCYDIVLLEELKEELKWEVGDLEISLRNVWISLE